MVREIEKAAQAILTDVYRPVIDTPAWLQRPGRHECRGQWPLVQKIYQALTGCLLPDTMPPREWRRVDGVFHGPSGRPFIFELDEKQHFNEFRATTLRLYPDAIRIGFSKNSWIDRCAQKRKTGRRRLCQAEAPPVSRRKRPPSTTCISRCAGRYPAPRTRLRTDASSCGLRSSRLDERTRCH